MRLVILAAALLVSVPVFAATAPPKPMTMAQALAARAAKQAVEKKAADAKAAAEAKVAAAHQPHAPTDPNAHFKVDQAAAAWQWLADKAAEPPCTMQLLQGRALSNSIAEQVVTANDKAKKWKR